MSESSKPAPGAPKRQPRRPSEPRSARAGRYVQMGIAVVAVVLVIESLFGSRGLSAMFDARRQYESASAELDKLRSENNHLRVEVKRLRDDPDAIEDAARRDLGYLAPGEKVFIIRDARPAPTTPDVPAVK